jgi:hypothetical protein
MDRPSAQRDSNEVFSSELRRSAGGGSIAARWGRAPEAVAATARRKNSAEVRGLGLSVTVRRCSAVNVLHFLAALNGRLHLPVANTLPRKWDTSRG